MTVILRSEFLIDSIRSFLYDYLLINYSYLDHAFTQYRPSSQIKKNRFWRISSSRASRMHFGLVLMSLDAVEW